MFTQHWLASLPFPVSGRQSRDRRGEASGRLANQTSRSDWRRGAALYSSAVVQGHTTVHSWTIWLKWRRYNSLVVIRPPQCWLDPATKVIFQMTSWWQHAITWHVCTLLLPGRTLPPAAAAQTTTQQNNSRPTLKLAFCSCCSVTSL